MQGSQETTTLLQRAVKHAADDLLVITDPVAGGRATNISNWIEEHVYIDRPRMPGTGDMLPKGPMRLAEYQRRVLTEAFRRDADGKLIYNTILWSEPKKSGKTALAAAAGLYMANMHDAAHIFCLANDGKQSQDRIFRAMDRCLRLHNQMGGLFAGCRAIYSPPTIKLPNGTIIEAVPCDAEGEAGSEPLMTIWSEMWGYAQRHKERLWTEFTLPPTLFGYAMRWVESYAGYEDESITLWQLYDSGVNNARRHEHFSDLPVYVNEAAKQLTFWSHEPRQPWQTEDYYKAERLLLTPSEFERVHRNTWTTSVSRLFEDMIMWDRCADPAIACRLKPGDTTPVIVALDAGYAEDTAAMYVVSRHPEDTWDQERRRVVERQAVAFYPPKGGKLDLTKTLEAALKRVVETLNVWMVVYDPYQLHKMCTDMRQQGLAPYKEFSQAGRRLRADKQLYDMIMHRQFVHSGDAVTRQHVQNCAKKESGEREHMRFVKMAAGKPIDLIVAASMATDECLTLNI